MKKMKENYINNLRNNNKFKWQHGEEELNSERVGLGDYRSKESSLPRAFFLGKNYRILTLDFVPFQRCRLQIAAWMTKTCSKLKLSWFRRFRAICIFLVQAHSPQLGSLSQLIRNQINNIHVMLLIFQLIQNRSWINESHYSENNELNTGKDQNLFLCRLDLTMKVRRVFDLFSVQY
jgi:hypothetical protein